MNKKNINGMSLFSGGGIGETYLENLGIHIKVANEYLQNRADFYSFQYPKAEIVCEDITKEETKDKLVSLGKKNKVSFLIATPPCQGMSNLGKREYYTDERNYLIFHVFDIMDKLDFDYILIENVPRFLGMSYPYKNKIETLLEIINDKYGDKYNIEAKILDAQYYGVPQRRKRAIVRIWKKGLEWKVPTVQKVITLQQAIGHLPSIESGEYSDIPFHYGPKIAERHALVLKHTPTGKSAHTNEKYYPVTKTGRRCKGFGNTYRRLEWDKVCPTRTMNSGSVSGSNNVHPGRKLEDGTYSDARTLSLLELFIVSSLPEDWKVPENCKEKLIRDIIGEGIPPMLTKSICEGIGQV